MKEQLRLEQKTSRERRKLVVVLGACLGLTLALIIVALIIDRLNPDIGFFWLDKMLAPKGFSFKELFGTI